MTQQAQMAQNTDAEKMVRTYLGAYPARDRAAIESVMGSDLNTLANGLNESDSR